MACKKCGSGWTTIHGADRASCPECCKRARCAELKSGRYTEPTEVKKCAECGGEFTATGIKEIAEKACCSAECQKARRVRANRAHRKRYASEEYKAANRDTVPAATKRERPRCAMCGKECTSRSSKKYCSPKCFVDARNAGVQPWDRSAIEEAARKRPNNVSQTPWHYFRRHCELDMLGFLRKVAGIYRAKDILDVVAAKSAKPVAVDGAKAMQVFFDKLPFVGTCPACDCQFVKDAARKIPHCSMQCASADCVETSCTRCGKGMKVHFLGGNFEARKARPMCWRCVIKTHPSQKGKRGHKGRCKKFGVPYDSSIRPHLVFERDDYTCHLCNRKTLPRVVIKGNAPHPRSPTIDHHPYPLSAGVMGHEWDNVRCACWECNIKKGARWTGQLPLPLAAEA